VSVGGAGAGAADANWRAGSNWKVDGRQTVAIMDFIEAKNARGSRSSRPLALGVPPMLLGHSRRR